MRSDRTDTSDRKQGDRPQTRKKARPGAAGLGFARKRDVEDRANQAAAPANVKGRYDRTGEDKYEKGLETFEQQRRDDTAKPSGAGGQDRWELDEGWVEFGSSSAPEADRGPRGRGRGGAGS